jgi:signal peptidase I
MKKRFHALQLRKYTHILKNTHLLYLKKKDRLSFEEQCRIEKNLKQLKTAIEAGDKPLAKEMAHKLDHLVKELLPKTLLEKARELTIILLVTLCLAILIRQMWFELYEIPTGSMRPTLKEKDRLVVSKTSFGINLPLKADHLYFSPQLVKRGGIIVFTGENMDIPNVDTRYFYIFPGKKQYVKRLMGKPGDTLYFYGGRIYGIDKEGIDITSELQIENPELIEHIPFLKFEGKAIAPAYPKDGIYAPIRLKQMNESIAKLSVTSANQLQGEMLLKNPAIEKHYSSLWGMKNFGMASVVNRKQALQYTSETENSLPLSEYYLQIRHHPSLFNLKLRKDSSGRMRPMFNLSVSLIPLDETHLRTLFENLYTVRFVVKNGTAFQYGMPSTLLQSPFLPKLPDVPNGTYEFYNGKAYKISFEGISLELDKNHPLYTFSPERVQMWYNLGMEFDTRFSPQSKNTPFIPFRYVYFRDQSFYAMGAPLFFQEDPNLIEFVKKEKSRKDAAPDLYPYRPFIDNGPPLLSDGSIDIEFIKTYGLTIPAKMYLALGDNHAISADSREFGFVPEENLKGAPDLVFWPPGKNFGDPNTPPYPFFNFPRGVIWSIVALSVLGSILWKRRRDKLPPL